MTRRVYLLLSVQVLFICACAKTDKDYGQNVTYIRIDTIAQKAEHLPPDVVVGAIDLHSMLQSMVRHGIIPESDVKYLSKDFWDDDFHFERSVEDNKVTINIRCNRGFSGGLGEPAVTITKRKTETDLIVKRHWIVK